MADVVTAIREHVTIAKAGLRLQANAERHLKNPAEMTRIFKDYPEAIANTAKFFRRLSFNLDELKHNYPTESADGETPAERLQRFVREGAMGSAIPAAFPKRSNVSWLMNLSSFKPKNMSPIS